MQIEIYSQASAERLMRQASATYSSKPFSAMQGGAGPQGIGQAY
jgi:hypothetical protein